MKIHARRSIHAIAADALSFVRTLQTEIADAHTDESVLTRGPSVTDLREGMIYIQRAWHALQMAVINRHDHTPEQLSQLMCELAGTALKIGSDIECLVFAADCQFTEAEDQP